MVWRYVFLEDSVTLFLFIWWYLVGIRSLLERLIDAADLIDNPTVKIAGGLS